MTTRAEFLARVRAEVRKTPGLFAATVAERPARPADAFAALRRELAPRVPAMLERFGQEFERVGGVLHRASSRAGVPDVVARLARERQLTRIVTSPPSTLGADLGGLRGAGLTVDAMADADVADGERERWRGVAAAADLGVTGVDLAIAETGSLVLVSGPRRPRSTSLLPGCHVAVLDPGVLVESLHHFGIALEAWHAGGIAGASGGVINVITGPSRTADIELTLTRGVHGPREVHVIVLDAPERGGA